MMARDRLRLYSSLLIVLSIMLAIINMLITKVGIDILNLQNVVNIVAIISGVSGVIMGLTSFKMANLDAVKEYFQQGDSDDFIKARKNVYKTAEEKRKIEKHNENAAKVISFFHFWGLMVKKKYLPIWVFEDASGFAVVKLYRILEPHIKERRADNPYYAKHFEWLANEIKKRYKDLITDFEKIEKSKIVKRKKRLSNIKRLRVYKNFYLFF